MTLRSSPDANVGCSGPCPRCADQPGRRLRSSPTRTSGAARRDTRTQGGPRRGCDPHRRERRVQLPIMANPIVEQLWLRSSPDANVGSPDATRIMYRGTRVLRSSPDANVGCSHRAPPAAVASTAELRSSPTRRRVQLPAHTHSGHWPLVAILTRRERRVQHLSELWTVELVAPGCDPHPTRTSGAACDHGRCLVSGCRLRSSPTRTSGAARCWSRSLCSSAAVAILTRRERRVQPFDAARRADELATRCDPHPTRTSGAAIPRHAKSVARL